MSQFPHLPLFTDAFIADTMHLNATETGAYLMLLMVAWRSAGCRLPDDDAKLCRYARVDPRTWARIKPSIMEFWSLHDGFWTQKRLLSEHDKVCKMAERARQNGKHGGRPKSLNGKGEHNPAGSKSGTQKKAPIPIPIDNTLESNLSKDADASQIDDPAEQERDLFSRGKAVLGPKAGGMIKKLLDAKHGNLALARAAIEQASTKQNPAEFVGAIVSGSPARNGRFGHSSPDDDIAGARRLLGMEIH